MNGVASPAVTPPKKFHFVGGALCLDFCNSVGGKRGLRTREHLHGFADFVSWCDQAELLKSRQSEELLRRAGHVPTEADEVLRRAIALREAIYRIFLAVSQHKRPADADLSTLNVELGRSLGRLRLAPNKSGFGWEWATQQGALDEPLGPIADSAAELLTNAGSLPKVRQCHGDTCGWLFLDSSKNHSRCWCDMRDCGNRAKVRRHRLRKKM